MDRSLDDSISSRQNNNRSRNRRGNSSFPRDGVRKTSQRDSPRNLDQDWVHDKYEDDDSRDSYRSQPRRRAQEAEPTAESGFKLKVENLHYEISEDDLRELFNRIGRVRSATLVYDRQDRSKGIGYVTYSTLDDAVTALNEYNGQKAYGQTIYLTMLPTAQPRQTAAPTGPSRSLFERIERPLERRIRDDRSTSPRDVRHSDVTRPAPEHIDRYVPGGGRSEGRNERRRSPIRRGERGGRGGGRRPGERRGQSGRTDSSGRPVAQGRPRKTQEELDAEMEDYFSKGDESATAANGAAHADGAAVVAAAATDDVDMIE